MDHRNQVRHENHHGIAGHAHRQPETADHILESFEHAHVDENVVTFFASGVYWLTPPGYGARSSGRQTTLLIGGRQQEKNFGDCRLLRSEFAPWGAYLLGDATAAYPSDVGLKRFHRHVVTPGPGVVVICDDVRAGGPVTTEWRMHPGEKLAVTPQGNRFVLKSAASVPKAACQQEERPPPLPPPVPSRSTVPSRGPRGWCRSA